MATTKTKPKPAPKAAATKAKPAPKSAAKVTKPRAATKSKAAAKPAPKAKAKAAPVESTPRGERGLHGFYEGTDSALIAEALVEGGESRGEVIENAAAKIEAVSGLTTRKGTEKAVASMTSGILHGLLKKGYTVEQSFRLVPPADIAAELKKAAAAEKRAAARKATAKKK